MNKKLSVLRRITAVVLCVTLLSSQVVVANAEDSERMNVQTNSEITDISEQDGFGSDTSEISDITESDIPDSFEGESEQNTDISTENFYIHICHLLQKKFSAIYRMKKKQLWMTKTHRTHWKK